MANKRRTTDRTIVQSQDEQLRSLRDFEKQRKIELANYAIVLQNVSTRKLVLEIFSYTGFYDVNAACDNTTFMAEGRRHVGQQIIELLNEIDDELYIQLLKDNINQQRGEDDGG